MIRDNVLDPALAYFSIAKDLPTPMRLLALGAKPWQADVAWPFELLRIKGPWKSLGFVLARASGLVAAAL